MLVSASRQMDKGKAIDRFLRRVDGFPQLVLVTDEEVSLLFGEEVTEALVRLERFSEEEKVCGGCGGVCCRDIGCELYASPFSQCPIHEFRPIVCRFHFCRRFDRVDKSLIIELRDVFLGCFMAVDFCDHVNLRSLDVPPLAEFCPELVAAAGPWVEAVQGGRLDPQHGAKLIVQEVIKYRDAHSAAEETGSLEHRAGFTGCQRSETNAVQDAIG